MYRRVVMDIASIMNNSITAIKKDLEVALGRKLKVYEVELIKIFLLGKINDKETAITFPRRKRW